MSSVITEPRGPRRRRRPLRGVSVVAIVAMVVVAVLILAAILAPVISPDNPINGNILDAYQLPSAHHLLGTDEFGRDLLSRVIYGGRVSLLGVAEATAIFTGAGLILGVLAGYFGGVLEAVVGWIADVSFAMPQIIVVLAVLAILSNDTSAAMIVLGVLGAPALAVFMSNATKSVRAEPYISAARVTGLRSSQIIVRHVLPQIISPLIVQVSLFAGTALLFQTGLDFLGLGTQPPQASWGSMVSEGATYLGRDLWMVVPGGLVIIVAVMSFGLIGDALQDARSERLRTRVAGDRRVHPAAAGWSIRDELDPPVESVLAVRGLTARTTGDDPVTIVDDVSFSLPAGACLGIVGESGCGKTMTAMSVIGLLPDGVETTGGEILFGGRDLRQLSDHDYRSVRGAGIAMISQEPIANLDPSFTVGQQIIEVVRRHRGLDRREARQRMLELLELVRLPDAAAVAGRYPHQLSGGMAQRVLIAIALAGDPRVLIADEPTTALDVTIQAEILALLRHLREETGLAVILVSHDWGVIADACDAAIVMYAGQVVEEVDEIDNVFDHPCHPYSYGLMSSNPFYATAPRTMLPSITGTVPAIGTWPQGCRFADRCWLATAECRASEVPLDHLTGGRWSRCVHTDQVPQLELEVAQ